MQKQGKFVLFTGADEFSTFLDGTTVSRSIALVQNHHTWLPNYSNFRGTNHFAMLQGMESSHLERGFAEIAQNLTTFPDGSIALCRSLDKIPAGIKGANSGGICIEHVGNFDAAGDQMTPAHRQTIIQLNALLCRKFHLVPNTDTIVYHHWYDLTTGLRTGGTGNTKTCPGTAFFGGNTVPDAQANFVPLVLAALGAAVPNPALKPVPLGSFTVNASALNVRSGPDSAAKVVKQLARGTRVDVYEANADWRRIHASEQQWVSARFLVPVP